MLNLHANYKQATSLPVEICASFGFDTPNFSWKQLCINNPTWAQLNNTTWYYFHREWLNPPRSAPKQFDTSRKWCYLKIFIGRFQIFSFFPQRKQWAPSSPGKSFHVNVISLGIDTSIYRADPPLRDGTMGYEWKFSNQRPKNIRFGLNEKF